MGFQNLTVYPIFEYWGLQPVCGLLTSLSEELVVRDIVLYGFAKPFVPSLWVCINPQLA